MRYLVPAIISLFLVVTPSQGQEFCADLCPDSCTLTATDALGVLNTAVGLNPSTCSPSTACPTEWPEPGDACEGGERECAYGEECCRGDCFDSYVCECEEREFACYYTDACLFVTSSTSSTTVSTTTTSTTTTTTPMT
jgi:hypothetical protein